MIILILIIGCSLGKGGNNKVRSEKVYKGERGLSIEILEESLPEKLFENEQTDLNIKLTNFGAYPITTSDSVLLVQVEKDYMQLTSGGHIKEDDISLMGKELYYTMNDVVLKTYSIKSLNLDEESQIQALDRTQPLLPMGLGYVEGVTHDYVRHGTTTLFAALDIASGHVLTQCKRRHRHQEFLQFLRHVEANVPEDLDIHLVVDNYSTHKHAKVRRWLASRPRYHVHYTPTYASWLNQVEIWFSILVRKLLKRASFSSTDELRQRILNFIDYFNKTMAKPYKWTYTGRPLAA